MAFDKSSAKAVSAARLGNTPKKVWTATFPCRNSTSRTALENYPSWTFKYAVSAELAKRKKSYSSFNFLTENLETFRSTELYGAPLEGLTIFVNRISSCRMSMESYRLAELEYAFFQKDQKTKRLKNYRAQSSFFGRSLRMGSLRDRQFYFNTAP